MTNLLPNLAIRQAKSHGVAIAPRLMDESAELHYLNSSRLSDQIGWGIWNRAGSAVNQIYLEVDEKEQLREKENHDQKEK